MRRAWLIAWLVLAITCAPALLVRQKGEDDCVVAAVAMLARQPYRDVLAVFAERGVSIPTWTVDAVRVAAVYGITLRARTEFPRYGTGLLSIGWCTGGMGHMVYVEAGEVYDPLGGVFGIDEYFTTRCAEIVVFLEKVEL